MAVLDVLTYPDPRLEEIAQPVEDFDDGLRAFIVDLEETRLAGPGAVGIAAPQVGRRLRIVIL
jgi:peptide deformylase